MIVSGSKSETAKRQRLWCSQYGLNYDVLIQIDDIVRDLQKRSISFCNESNTIPPAFEYLPDNPQNFVYVQRMLLTGYFQKVCMVFSM